MTNSFILHLHPLSSYCHKVLIGLYENSTPFTAKHLNLMDESERAAFLKLSPFGKMPALEDTARNRTVNETSIILDYVDQHYPGSARLIPRNADAALTVRLWDRFFDLYLHDPMQRIVAQTFRPADAKDAFGENEARKAIRRAYDVLEERLGEVPYPGGEAFSMADCAAAPALFYAQATEPFADDHPRIARYFDALVARPSYGRVLEEAKPFLQYFPLVNSLPARFRP